MDVSMLFAESVFTGVGIGVVVVAAVVVAEVVVRVEVMSA